MSFRILKTYIKTAPGFLHGFFRIKRMNKHKEKYDFHIRHKRVKDFFSLILRGYYADIHILNPENQPKKHSYVACNHTHLFDPLLLISSLDEETSVITKIENIKAPFISTVVNCIDGKYIDRNNPREAIKLYLSIEKEYNENIRNWSIYPEGTRNKGDKSQLLPFHEACFKFPMRAGVDICPVVTYGLWEITNNKFKGKTVPIIVKFLKPITKEMYENMTTIELSNLVRNEMQKALTDEVVPLYNKLLKGLK